MKKKTTSGTYLYFRDDFYRATTHSHSTPILLSWANDPMNLQRLYIIWTISTEKNAHSASSLVVTLQREFRPISLITPLFPFVFSFVMEHFLYFSLERYKDFCYIIWYSKGQNGPRGGHVTMSRFASPPLKLVWRMHACPHISLKNSSTLVSIWGHVWFTPSKKFQKKTNACMKY